MRLRFLGFPHADSYLGSSEVGPRWYAGEEREVSPEVAEYLTGTFAGAFVPVVVEPVATSIDAPPAHRAMKSPKVRR